MKKCFTGGNNFFSLSVIICTHGVSTNENVVKKAKNCIKYMGSYKFVYNCTHQLICI